MGRNRSLSRSHLPISNVLRLKSKLQVGDHPPIHGSLDFSLTLELGIAPSGKRGRIATAIRYDILSCVNSDKWKNQYIDLINSLPEYILTCDNDELSSIESKILSSKKERYSSYIVELGSGSGGHILSQAAMNPETLYFGFELRYKRAFRTAEKAMKQGLTNILIARTDARRVSEFFGAASLDGIFVNFPDPWEKMRWRKHRMLNEESLMELRTLLKPNGFISYKTDHQGYFLDTINIVRSLEGFSIERCVESQAALTEIKENVETEFEKLFKSKGIPVNYALIRKS